MTERGQYNPRQAVSRNLVLNIVPVQFDDADIVAGVLKFKDKDQLRALRKAHWQTHIFKRITSPESDEILAVQLDGKASTLGDQTRTVRLSENLGVTSNLIRSRLLRYFHESGSEIFDFAPIKVMSRKPSGMFLPQVAPAGTTCPDWLAVSAMLEIDVRIIAFEKRPPFIGLVLNVRTVRRIRHTCDALLKDGLDLTGLYVAEAVDRDDPRITPRQHLLGRVTEVESGILKLSDCRDKKSEIAASSATLEASRDAFTRCVAHAFGNQAQLVEVALDTRLATARGGKWKQDRIREVFDNLSKAPNELLPGMKFMLERILNEQNNGEFPVVRTTLQPMFIFDPTNQRANKYKPWGLNEFGPYSRPHHTPTQPRVCVICEQNRKGEVEQYLHKFLHGVPAPVTQQDAKSYYPKGFIKLYYLEDFTPHFFTAQNATAAAYRKAAQNALEEQGVRPWDLALVQVDEATHDMRGEQNPYLVTKASFMSQQIPVQEFETETMRYTGRQMEFSLSNMALATYAKLGGVPWLLQADRTIAHELVIGLGSASVAGSRLGERERFVGITTMFTGDGNYFLGSLSKAVAFDDYKPVLLETLARCVDRAKTQMNWEKGDQVRLIFHCFKPMKDTEAEAVKAIADSLTDYKVEFAFVHVVDNHPLAIFDTHQKGKYDPEHRATKGESVPDRGFYLKLNSKEVLLTLTGPAELKKPTDGMPYPVLLRLHKSSTFHDVSYLAKQVFVFSSHSWRSFLPASMPVTIMYSQLMARLLGKLNTLPQWNPDSIIGKLNRSRWFL
jgi:hypothetical protein